MNNSRNNAPVRQVHVWINPPSTPLPLKADPIRFAVGTPVGHSSNSWRVWIRGKDAYVACRDNYREFKVSLHTSGIWRLGFTEKAIRDHPHLIPIGEDRAWKKWRPIRGNAKNVIVAFQIVVPPESLFLSPKHRKGWPSSVVFVEPPTEATKMTVVSVGVAQSQNAAVLDENIHGAVIAVVPLDDSRSVQLVATYSDDADFKKVVLDGASRLLSQIQAESLPDQGVLFIHGERANNIPWVTAIPVSCGPTITEYNCERAGYDYSPDQTVHVQLPAAWLMEALSLRLTDGCGMKFVDEKGNTQFFDPSLDNKGPKAGLIDRDAFLGALEAKGFAAVWIIAGEKNVYGHRDSRGFGGRHRFTSFYWQSDNQWQRHDHHDFLAPEREQVKSVLGSAPPSWVCTRD